nr:MAG: hypothetical protein J07AB56_09220 [Candidatus Nanosalinarum sp. J07AB56]
MELPDFDSDGPSVHRVRGEMATVLEWMRGEEEAEAFEPFLFAYHAVTSRVSDILVRRPGFFGAPEEMQRLDEEFAVMYFDALEQYLDTGEAPRPWRTYFDYCSSGGRPVVQMVLGMNAHINGDLPVVLAGTGYSNREDFDRINGVLESEVGNVSGHLARRHDIAGVLGLLDRGLARREFRQLIVDWRRDAWENSRRILSGDTSREEVFAETEALAEEIVSLDEEFDYLNLFSTLRKANRLSL